MTNGMSNDKRSHQNCDVAISNGRRRKWGSVGIRGSGGDGGGGGGGLRGGVCRGGAVWEEIPTILPESTDMDIAALASISTEEANTTPRSQGEAIQHNLLVDKLAWIVTQGSSHSKKKPLAEHLPAR